MRWENNERVFEKYANVRPASDLKQKMPCNLLIYKVFDLFAVARTGFEPVLIINKIRGNRKENRKDLFCQALHPTTCLCRIEK